MQLEVKSSSKGKDWSTLSYKSLGGGYLDFFLFYGPSYLDVIKQYQEVIGHPKMMPLWAHGLMSRSFAYKDTNLALDAI